LSTIKKKMKLYRKSLNIFVARLLEYGSEKAIWTEKVSENGSTATGSPDRFGLGVNQKVADGLTNWALGEQRIVVAKMQRILSICLLFF